jgi:hypothetical protein
VGSHAHGSDGPAGGTLANVTSTGWRGVVDETLGVALGREHRLDPVLPGTGGPAGNARLTAWTGLVLLVLFVAELVTLLDVHGLIGWHLAIGVILIPPALLKTATTGWRILRYYVGDAEYRKAGPPPLLLRLLGPLVVLGSLALLGTGLALVVLGEERSREPLFTVVGQRVDVLTLHQASFAVWAVVTGVHVLVRLIPAWQNTAARIPVVPGRGSRTLVLAGSVVVAGLCAVLVLAHPGGWSHDDRFRAHDPDIGAPGAAVPHG